MPKYLRRIEDENIWLNLKNNNYQSYDWLTCGEDIPSEPIIELRPITDSQLSLYFIYDNDSNLKQVLAALGANRFHRHAEYILIDDSHLNEFGFKIEKTDGHTKDRQVNEEWHFDLKELSGFKLVTLTKLFLDKGEFEVCYQHDFLKYISESINKGTIHQKKLPAELLNLLKS